MRFNKKPGKRIGSKILPSDAEKYRKKNNSKMGNITQKWVDLLIPFAGNYSARLTASQLSKKTGVPQQTASRCLNEIVKNNMISYTLEGRNKLFYFDFRAQPARNIFTMIENQKSLDFQMKNRKIGAIISELLDNSEALAVFGSYASGKAIEDSDLDVVVFNGDRKKIEKIKARQPIGIHEHYISFNEFSRILKSRNALSIEILDNHILFGNISKLVDIFLRWFSEHQ